MAEGERADFAGPVDHVRNPRMRSPSSLRRAHFQHDPVE